LNIFKCGAGKLWRYHLDRSCGKKQYYPRVKEEKNALHTIKPIKANPIGQILRRNFVEVKTEGKNTSDENTREKTLAATG
jgi:hypothetical protein